MFIVLVYMDVKDRKRNRYIYGKLDQFISNRWRFSCGSNGGL